MARTFISQTNQVFSSENYNDALVTGSALQTTSGSLEFDLNAIRTQIRQTLWANVSGSWYDAISTVSGTLGVFPGRGVNTLGIDLSNIEQKRFLTRRTNLTSVSVNTGSNIALLSVFSGSAPANFAVVDNPNGVLTGTIVATSTYGSWSNAIVSGTTVLTPKNLVLIRDAITHNPITSSLGHEIFGLLQVEAGTIDGATFNDVNVRTQISFIEEITISGSSTLLSCSISSIEGRTFNYQYVYREALTSLLEDAFLFDNIFADKNKTSTSTGSFVAPATQVGQVMFSTDGATFGARLPVTHPDYGWLMQNDGILIVVG